MSRDGALTADWADGTHEFRLAWGQLIELQEACDAGPYYILQRLFDGSWRVEYISQVMRLGLIGGGMPPPKALALVRRYVEERPPMENVLWAQAVLSAALMGARDEELEKRGSRESTTLSEESSESHMSSATLPQ
jgi:hypothetical protein